MADAAPFNLAQLARSIGEARVARDLTWAALARDVGVAQSTIKRFAVASDAEADGVLALVGWLGACPEDFVVNSTVAGSSLPPAGAGTIRVDMGLVNTLPAGPRRRRTGSRTTIQALVVAAQESCRTVASLTRWSAV